ncbi:Uncharacterized protein Adt_39906 [Abeliophyllum distichum]|uniref:Uncharacterized protein n=1 Tax=Abeliophyllum distichum TaxID=126358 RepID=A0ABD1Q6G4_9LAMI
MNSRQNYAKATRKEPVESWQVHGHRPKAPLISFTEEDKAGIHYLHCDALVVRAIVARNGLGRMLVDDGSAVNILFGSAFDQMEVDHKVMAISEPLFGFTGDSLIPRRRITLAVDFGESLAPHQEIHGIPDSGHPLRLPCCPRKARVEGSARRSHPYTT